MTQRNLPAINARSPGTGVEWDPPVKARERWTPVRAAREDERSLNIFGEIGERWDGEGVTDRYVAAVLRRMGAGPVAININSPGGDFFTGAAIYNQLREHDGEVTVNVLGVAASAASVIAMGSDTLRVARAGFLMIHNSWGLVMGNRHDMADAAALFAQFDGAMAAVYAERSGMTRAKVESYMDKDTFFNGEEAVKAGLADALLASDEVEEDDEPAARAAYRRLDLELATKGIPRAERRALLAEVSGTPCAAADVTPCADEAIAAEMRRIVNLIKD